MLGLFEDDSLMDFDWGDWDRHFAIHLKAPAMLARQFAEGFAAGAEGLIVNMIDQRVWRPTPRYFSYTLSKSALWTATQTMAQALAPRIRVNAIGPGPTLRNASRRTSSSPTWSMAAAAARSGASEFGATIRYLVAGAVGDRPDDRARRRPASCLADAGCDGAGRMSTAAKNGAWRRRHAADVDCRR